MISRDNPKYMMATTAIHKLGDISSDEPDICCITGEDEENYIGNWITGYGFINVKFPKATTRDLTEEEIEHYKKQKYQIGSGPVYSLNLK